MYQQKLQFFRSLQSSSCQSVRQCDLEVSAIQSWDSMQWMGKNHFFHVPKVFCALMISELHEGIPEMILMNYLCLGLWQETCHVRTCGLVIDIETLSLTFWWSEYCCHEGNAVSCGGIIIAHDRRLCMWYWKLLHRSESKPAVVSCLSRH